jgi:hypothetical protein
MFVRPPEDITVSSRIDMTDFVHTESLEHQVQGSLNLVLEMKSPAQMPALMRTIAASQGPVHEALRGLHYVHSARFLPTRDGTYLQVITVFDGDMASYIMDFVVVIGDIFNAMLVYVKNAPPLPVQAFPREFLAWVLANNLAQFPAWVAYPDVTTIDIITGHRGL